MHDQISGLRDKFEQAYDNEQRPLLNEILEGAAPAQRSQLFIELLPLDVASREKAGEHPQRHEYIEQFPELQDVIDEFFLVRDTQVVCDATSNSQQATKQPQSTPRHIAARDDVTVPPAVDSTASPAELGTLPLSDESKPVTDAWEVGGKIRYFGDYELLQEIARGGMGVVYKARQRSLNRVVAVKMILAGQLAGDEDVRRFYAEAEAAANLNHPGIVPIHEIGQSDGQHYFSMGYIEGTSLATKAQEGPLPPKVAAEYLHKIAAAVQFAHAKGVIHRDLKPSNVLIDKDDEPKVTDFGLAKKLESDSQLTGTGQILGTPSYMPPEQASGDMPQVDHQSDVYSLGAMLYCLLTGRPPFQAASPMDTLLQVLDEEPVSIRRLNAHVPRDLETICLKCLQKEKSRRYATAQDVVDELERFSVGKPIVARPVGKLEKAARWSRRNPVGTAFLALLLLLAAVGPLIAVRQMRLRHQAEDARVVAERAEISERTQRRLAESMAENIRHQQRRQSIDRAGNLLNRGDASGAFFWLAQALPEASKANHGERDLALSQLNAVWQSMPRFTQLWQVPNRINQMVFSPNEDRLLIVDGDHSAQIWDTATGSVLGQPMQHGSTVWSAAFSPDGERVATAGGVLSANGELRLWNARTGAALGPPATQPTMTFFFVAFLGAGDRLLTVGVDITGNARARAWDIDEETNHLRASGRGVAFRPRSPQHDEISGFIDEVAGRVLVATPEELRVLDAATGQTVSQLASDVCWPEQPQARLVLARYVIGQPLVWISLEAPNGQNALRLWNPATEEFVGVPLSLAMSDLSLVRLFPDRRKGIVVTASKEISLFDIPSGKVLGTLNTVQGPAAAVSFSDDSRFIALALTDGSVQVWDALNNRAAAPLLQHGEAVSQFEFASNGRQLATSTSGGTIRLWDFSTSSRPVQLHHSHSVAEVRTLNDGSVAVASWGSAGQPWAQLWKATEGQIWEPIRTEEMELTEPNITSINSTGHFGVGNRKGQAVIRHLLKPEQGSFTLQHDAPIVRHVAFSPNGSVLGTIAAQSLAGPSQYLGTLYLWDANTGSPLAKRINFQSEGLLSSIFSATGTPTSGVTCMAFDGKGERVLIGGARISSQSIVGEARMLDARTGEVIGKPLPQPRGTGVFQVRFHTRANLALTGARDPISEGCELRLWDLDEFKMTARPVRTAAMVNVVDFSPDAESLAVAHAERVEIFESTTLQRRSRALFHPAVVTRLSFHPSLPLLATACTDQSVRVWDLRTATLFMPPIKNLPWINDVGFSGEGHLLAGGADGNLYAWTLDRGSWSDDQIETIAHAFAGATFNENDGEVPLESERIVADWEQLSNDFSDEFRTSDAEVSGWHNHVVEVFESRQMWAAALAHRHPVLQREPANLPLRRHVAQLHCQIGEFAAALRHLLKIVAQEPDNHLDWYQLATAQLAANDYSGYRATCQDLVRRWANTEDPVIAERFSKICSLSDASGVSADVLDKWSAFALNADPNHVNFPWFQLARGIVLYRQQEFSKAEETMRQLVDGEGTLTIRAAMAQAFLAMSLQQRDRNSEAKNEFKRVTEYHNQLRTRTQPWGSWLDTAQLSVVLDEARTLIVE